MTSPLSSGYNCYVTVLFDRVTYVRLPLEAHQKSHGHAHGRGRVTDVIAALRSFPGSGTDAAERSRKVSCKSR